MRARARVRTSGWAVAGAGLLPISRGAPPALDRRTRHARHPRAMAQSLPLIATADGHPASAVAPSNSGSICASRFSRRARRVLRVRNSSWSIASRRRRAAACRRTSISCASMRRASPFQMPRRRRCARPVTRATPLNISLICVPAGIGPAMVVIRLCASAIDVIDLPLAELAGEIPAFLGEIADTSGGSSAIFGSLKSGPTKGGADYADRPGRNAHTLAGGARTDGTDWRPRKGPTPKGRPV